MRKLRDQVYLRSDLLADGVSDSQLRAALRNERLIPLAPGVYMQKECLESLSPRELHLARVAARIDKSDRLVISHDSAAAVWGLPLMVPWPESVHTYAPGAAAGGRRTASRIWHKSSYVLDVVEADGFSLTSVAQTIADTALLHGELAALVQLDYALGARMVKKADFDVFLERGRGGPGSKRLSEVLRWADARAESVGESVSRFVMRKHRIPAPGLQVEVPVNHGAKLYRTDFGWLRYRILGEFDGKVKYGREYAKTDSAAREALWQEKIREDELRREGYTVVRWTWADIQAPYRMIDHLRRAGLPGRKPASPIPLGIKNYSRYPDIS